MKTSLSGIVGIKGCVALRFNYEDTSFAFLNVDLDDGIQDQERLDNLNSIYNQAFRSLSVYNTQEKCSHDYKCIFGSFNFKNNLKKDEI